MNTIVAENVYLCFFGANRRMPIKRRPGRAKKTKKRRCKYRM